MQKKKKRENRKLVIGRWEWWSWQLGITETMPVLLHAFPIRKLFFGVFQLSVIGQSNPSPYRLIWKKFLPLYKTVYSRSSRKQGWSMQKKNIYKSHLWCQMNEMWAMNHVQGWAGSAFHYHNWPTSLFALTVLIPNENNLKVKIQI